MHVTTAIESRKSVRAFLDRPVSIEVVKEILQLAGRAPSGSNLQPWRVYAVVGPALNELVRHVHSRMPEHPRGEQPEYTIHPPEMGEPYQSRYFRASALLYRTLGISREDIAARQRHLARNWEFFGAPVGLIFTIHRHMQPGQWADLGMFMQSIMLAACAHGLDTCAQEAWALWPKTLKQVLPIGDREIVVCGMALGHADPNAAVNRISSERADLSEILTVVEKLVIRREKADESSTR
jgi:nitroreductase